MKKLLVIMTVFMATMFYTTVAYAQDKELTFTKNKVFVNGIMVYHEQNNYIKIVDAKFNNPKTHILIKNKSVFPTNKTLYFDVRYLNPNIDSKFKSFPCGFINHEVNYDSLDARVVYWKNNNTIEVKTSKSTISNFEIYHLPFSNITFPYQHPQEYFEIRGGQCNSDNPELYTVYLPCEEYYDAGEVHANVNPPELLKGYYEFQKWLNNNTDPCVVKIKYYPDPTPYLK